MLWYTTTLRVCFRLVRWKPRQKTLPNFTFQHTSRTLSTSPCASTPYEINKPLKQWTLVVNPFSKVRAQLTCSISIRPLDPHAFPESNRAFITVHGTSADQGIKLDNVHVHYDDQSKELLILSEKVNSNMSVELTAPVKSGEWSNDVCIWSLGRICVSHRCVILFIDIVRKITLNVTPCCSGVWRRQL